jgi:acyl carrier protein phosphodiesterase
MKRKKRLSLVRLYAGAFVDVAMDYFVANDFQAYIQAEWKDHSLKVYRVLNANSQFLPENFKKMLVKMEHDDWLYNYRGEIKFSIKMF